MPADGDLIIRSVSLSRVLGPDSVIRPTDLPEYALAGRSNAGKSSLINMILRRKRLARTSASPGKTRTINYYLVNNAFYLVDLPGYGYADMPERERARIGEMAERYLDTTVTLKKVFLLVDMRHKPTADDILMYQWIVGRGYEPVVLTAKADKLGRNERAKALKLIRSALSMPDDGVLIPTSVVTGEGLGEMYALLA